MKLPAGISTIFAGGSGAALSKAHGQQAVSKTLKSNNGDGNFMIWLVDATQSKMST